MKANNLSISVPNKGCDKSCPYCISKMTGYTKNNISLMKRNIDKVKRLADVAEVSSVSLTGKGEPMLNISDVLYFAEQFKNYPLEIQTNGHILIQVPEVINDLFLAGIDVVAISIDNFEEIDLFSMVFEKLNEVGITIRLTFNLVEEVYNRNVEEFFTKCEEYNIDQISFREITTPTIVKDSVVSNITKKWIEDNVDKVKSIKFTQGLIDIRDKSQFIRSLPYGASLYSYKGVSFTYFDYCIQDSSSNDDIRSLIFYEDGHVSTTWYGSNMGRIL